MNLQAKSAPTFLAELTHTARSILSACHDWLVLRTPLARFIQREQTFAFLVHPRTDDFTGGDVYGANDIYRPFPVLRRLFDFLPKSVAQKLILLFAKTINPITLSRIQVDVGNRKVRGYLLSTVRTPMLLFGYDRDKTRVHLTDLFLLAARKGVQRVGLGALLPSVTGYGKRFTDLQLKERPAVSTGHAYTAYTIARYLTFLITKRHSDFPSVRVAIVGAGGSTGKAVVRVLKSTWDQKTRLDLTLVDVSKKELALRALAKEALSSGKFANVQTATDLTSLHGIDYVVVVTNATSTLIRPEHVDPGTVIVDDSQPRNTSPELVSCGCHVLDVLACVPGLDCNFDFGFRTEDRSVTFTCLAETVLATAVGDPHDLAVGEVTDEVVTRMLDIVESGERLGLVGPLPFFSFGRELSAKERDVILQPVFALRASVVE